MSITTTSSTIKTLLMSILVILAPVKPVMITAFILVLADLVTGIWAAQKRHESITSAGLRRTITKLLIYQITIVLGFITQQYLTGDLVPLSKIISAFIGLTEMKSITENLNHISGGSLLKALVERLTAAKTKEET